MKRNLCIPFAVAALFLAPIAQAGMPGSSWDQIHQAHDHAKAAREKLEQAEKAQPGDRHRLMQEHMQAMEKAMEQMHAAKPGKGMSMEDHERWMSEHQKFMDEVMGQMAREHKMMMMGCGGQEQSKDHAH